MQEVFPLNLVLKYVRYYAAKSGNLLPTLQEILSAPIFKDKEIQKKEQSTTDVS
jgi:hypothetical protein